MRSRRLFIWTILQFALASTGRADVDARSAEPNAEHKRTLEDWLGDMQKRLVVLDDYTTVVVVQERCGGKMEPDRYYFLKYRTEPKSFHLFTLTPAHSRGCQVWFMQGRNDDRLIAHTPRGCVIQWMHLHPDDPMVLGGARTPLPKLNMHDLLDTTITVLRNCNAFTAADWRLYEGARINGRQCTMAQVRHEDAEGPFEMRVFRDDEYKLPVRFVLRREDEVGDKRRLVESYTFVRVKFSNQLTDDDFTAPWPGA